MILRVALISAAPIFCFGCEVVFAQVDALPAWAYPVNVPNQHARKSDANASRQVPDSSAVFTNAQVSDLFLAPDWHPEEHSQTPAVVARGRALSVYALRVLPSDRWFWRLGECEDCWPAVRLHSAATFGLSDRREIDFAA